MAVIPILHTQEPEYFRFCDLPAELRNRIYEKTFEGSLVLHAVRRHPSTRKYDAPGILLASKQTYSEAVMTFYQATTFYWCHIRDGLDWYNRLPLSSRNAVTCVRFDTAPALKKFTNKDERLGVQQHLLNCGRKKSPRIPKLQSKMQVRVELDSGEVIWTSDWRSVVKAEVAAR